MHTATLSGPCEKCGQTIEVNIEKVTPVTYREDLIAISSNVNISGRGITLLSENLWQTRSCPKNNGLKHVLKN